MPSTSRPRVRCWPGAAATTAPLVTPDRTAARGRVRSSCSPTTRTTRVKPGTSPSSAVRVDEAVQIALGAAGGKNVEVFSPTIGRQLLALGLIDEIDLHIAPVPLGDGIRLYDSPYGRPIGLDRVGADDPKAVMNVRYRPIAPAKRPT